MLLQLKLSLLLQLQLSMQLSMLLQFALIYVAAVNAAATAVINYYSCTDDSMTYLPQVGFMKENQLSSPKGQSQQFNKRIVLK